jgi:hypothetical protein
MLEHSSFVNVSTTGYPDPVSSIIVSGHHTKENEMTYENEPDPRVSMEQIVVRFARIAIVTLVALLSGYVASPEVLALVGEQGAVILTAVVVPTLAALDKYLRERWAVKRVLAARAAQQARAEASGLAKPAA